MEQLAFFAICVLLVLGGILYLIFSELDLGFIAMLLISPKNLVDALSTLLAIAGLVVAVIIAQQSLAPRATSVMLDSNARGTELADK